MGLRNAEVKYDGTRHNIGADTVQRLGERLGAAFKPHKSGAEVADTWYRPGGRGSAPPAPPGGRGSGPPAPPGGVPLSLVLPFGYMNRSGGPVQSATAFYKVPHERLIVVHDDLDLEPGTLRLKRGGGTAGHNGLRDIQQRTGSADFYRVRVGIGRPPGRQDPADYVLRRFSAKERDQVDVTVEEACDAILDLITGGLEQAQNRHH